MKQISLGVSMIVLSVLGMCGVFDCEEYSEPVEALQATELEEEMHPVPAPVPRVRSWADTVDLDGKKLVAPTPPPQDSCDHHWHLCEELHPDASCAKTPADAMVVPGNHCCRCGRRGL